MSPAMLSDDNVADIRAAAAEGGQSLAEIAVRFGTSKQHVSRLVRGEQREVFSPSALVAGNSGGSVVATVRAELDAMGVDPDDDVGAITAIALAEKLDSVRMSNSAQSAIATPGLARALAETLTDLQRAGAGGPRLGALRDEEAVLMARVLGISDPENVCFERFDRLALLKIGHARRRAHETGCSCGQRLMDWGLGDE